MRRGRSVGGLIHLVRRGRSAADVSPRRAAPGIASTTRRTSLTEISRQPDVAEAHQSRQVELRVVGPRHLLRRKRGRAALSSR